MQNRLHHQEIFSKDGKKLIDFTFSRHYSCSFHHSCCLEFDKRLFSPFVPADFNTSNNVEIITVTCQIKKINPEWLVISG